MIRRPLALFWLASIAALGACRKGQGSRDAPPMEDGAGPANDTAPATSAAVRPARCATTDQRLSFDDGGLDGLEIGDAISYGDRQAVAAVHRAPIGRSGVIVLVDMDAGSVRSVNLGPTLGDAPPPRMALCKNGELVAAALEVPSAAARGAGAEARRSLALWSLAPRSADVPSATLLWSVPQPREESLAFDVACSGVENADLLVVWDASVAVGGRVHGLVRLLSSGVGRAPSAPRDLSPPESDVELPRIVKAGAGFFALWLAHRPEPSRAPEASPDLEATGEARSYGWLEMVAVNGAGSPTGPVRRLTPTSGHVSSYDVQSLPEEPAPTVLVAARDDGETADGTGGSLLGIRVRDDVVEPAAALATDGLGRGAPTFVEGAAPWVTWVGPREELRLLPLDRTGAPSGAPSAEEALNEARPLLVLPGEGRILVAIPADRAAQLRVFRCPR